ncbi:MAG: DbpA RNA-binding domain protein [Gemmatimonadetes bacterium]|nr:DbpA RNA-binding domain protein [Gemmatimonadota bacterium]
MEQDAREVGTISRGQNVVYVMPHDWASISQFLAPAVERVDDGARELQVLIISSDAEVAAVMAAAAVKLAGGRDVGIVAATSARRAATLIRARPAQILSGTPETLVELLKGAAVKLDAVRAVCIAWADELVTRGGAEALETLMAELPKEGARIVVTSELNPAVEELLERYARRARRVASPLNESDLPTNVEYVTVSAHSRLSALRRVLDELDPKSAVVFVRDIDGNLEARDLLRALGYQGPDATVKIGLVAPPGTALAVLFDLPTTREELREAAAGAARTVALVQPRQLASLRTLAAGGTVKPLTLPDSGDRARDRDERMRAEVREVLRDGQFGRELLALEPLLDEYDGIEIAAATMQLLDRERVARAAALSAAAPRDRASTSMTRLFVSVGSRDNVRPGDLVGAIANEAGVSSSDIGKVDVRESHSIVEVSADIVGAVIEKVTGTDIRGRRAVVRRDEERPARGERPGRDRSTGGSGGGARGSRDRGERGDRPSSGSDRPPRGAGRGPRP